MSGGRILIAEDQAVVALEIEDRLRRLGYEVVGVAPTGADAVRLAEEREPELLLFDIRLQGELDGVDAAKTIRQRRQLPVVFLSAYADEATLRRVRAVEPAAYLLKPFDERMLEITLDTALYKHRIAVERNREERERRAVEARLAAVLSHSPDAIISAGEDRSIEVCNPSATQMFGYELHELRSMTLDDLLCSASCCSGLFDELTRRVSDDRSAVVGRELDARRKDGSVFPAEVSVSQVAVDGEVSITAIVRDVTERKRLEERFLHAQKLQAVGRLAAGVAHDFNNLLSAIQCSAFLARAAAQQPEALDREVRAITASVRRGAALTRQLLGFAKRVPGSPKPVELGEAVASLEGLIQILAGADTRLEMNLEVGAGTVEIDASRLEQVVMNLVSNARDAMPERGVLTFDVARYEAREPFTTRTTKLPAGAYVRLTVRDNGCGMTEEVRQHIFEPFFTTKGGQRGTGLGLSTVLEVVEENAGGIDVESQPGQGTSFHLYFPCSEAEAVPPASDRTTVPPPPALDLDVLVVDDDTALLASMARVLELIGCRVQLATNGSEALARAEEGAPFDLAIVDLVMPGANGREVARALTERMPGLPVLFTSGHPDPVLDAEQVDALGLRLLSKPFSISDLQEAVAATLGEIDEPRSPSTR